MLAGLAVLSSDALSSVAYATEEVLRVLMVGGVDGARASGQPIAGLIATAAADRRVLVPARRSLAYPQGGGDYIVTKENLGTELRWRRPRPC